MGKSSFYVKNLQRALKLYVPDKKTGYSLQYLRFMEKAVSLRALNVPQEKIIDLFEVEKKILEMLHIDSISNSKTWYLDACVPHENGDKHLLLTGYDLGFPIDEGHIQHHLDFSERNPELFKGSEMGEDVRLVLEKYTGQLEDIKKKVHQEEPVLRNALAWAEEALAD